MAPEVANNESAAAVRGVTMRFVVVPPIVASTIQPCVSTMSGFEQCLLFPKHPATQFNKAAVQLDYLSSLLQYSLPPLFKPIGITSSAGEPCSPS